MPRPLLVALASLLAAACSGTAEPEPGEELALPLPPPQAIVATVDGAPITSERLARQMRDARQSKEAALRALIHEELLAAEARRRGLGQDPQVAAARARALAAVFLEREFRYTPADVSRAELQRAFELNRTRYQHPELRRVSHIVALLPRQAEPAHLMEAARLARQVHGRLSEEEFKQIAPLVAKDARLGIVVRAESLTTPRSGFTVEAFAAAAFALDPVGAVSPIVETRFGSHVIYLAEKLAARNATLADPGVEREIREKLFEDSRRQAFLRFQDELWRRYQVELHPERIPPRLGGTVAP